MGRAEKAKKRVKTGHLKLSRREKVRSSESSLRWLSNEKETSGVSNLLPTVRFALVLMRNI
jgi:hypothetical protein